MAPFLARRGRIDAGVHRRMLLTAALEHGNSHVRHDPSLGRRAVAKPEWGTKRICQSCGARFYDLNRDPVVCPSCGTPFDPAVQTRPRRARAPAKVVAVVPEEVEVDPVVETETEGNAADDAADDEQTDDDDSDSAIEDVSELGDDDMTDVIDTEIEDDEAER
jgi:uncharacterized protein (TIGR02300 family)